MGAAPPNGPLRLNCQRIAHRFGHRPAKSHDHDCVVFHQNIGRESTNVVDAKRSNGRRRVWNSRAFKPAFPATQKGLAIRREQSGTVVEVVASIAVGRAVSLIALRGALGRASAGDTRGAD
jgi:hypothetical protein